MFVWSFKNEAFDSYSEVKAEQTSIFSADDGNQPPVGLFWCQKRSLIASPAVHPVISPYFSFSSFLWKQPAGANLRALTSRHAPPPRKNP